MNTEERIQLFRKRRFFHLGDGINEETVDDMQAAILLMLDDNPELPIYTVINSHGGSIRAGLVMYDFIKSIPAAITGYVNGNCDSMALIVLAAHKKRLCTPHSTFLYHAATFNLTLRSVLQTKNDIQRDIDEFENLISRGMKIHTNTFNMTEKKFIQLCENGERTKTLLFAEEARNLNIITEIVTELPPIFSLK